METQKDKIETEKKEIIYINHDSNAMKYLMTLYNIYVDSASNSLHNHWDYHISKTIPTSKAHNPTELLFVCYLMLQYGVRDKIEGDIVEFGCYTGISTAKISMIAQLLDKQLYVFDSFEGLPDPTTYGTDKQKEIYEKGMYISSLGTAKNNVKNFGCINSTRFVKGWFCDTLPNFRDIEKISYAFIDVDLNKSFEECMEFILPRLQKGSVIFSHEADDEDYMENFEKYGLLDETKFRNYFNKTEGLAHMCHFVKV